MLIAQIVPERKLITIQHDETIKNAAIIMKNEKVSSLLVKKDDEIVGIVTERDVVYSIANGIHYDEKVEKIMTKNLITIEANKDVSEAVILMLNKNVRHLVVKDKDNKIIGVISVRDLMRAFLETIIDLAVW
jgi:predicted transcriptional regulator